jgi:hypothetical protein
MVSLLRYAWQLNAIRTGRGASAGFVRSGHSLKDTVVIVWSAYRETVKHLPALLRKRALCRQNRRICPAEFARLMDLYRISARDLAYSG